MEGVKKRSVKQTSSPPEGFEQNKESPTAWLRKVKNFNSADIEPIAFLSKCLSDTEKRYFPTDCRSYLDSEKGPTYDQRSLQSLHVCRPFRDPRYTRTKAFGIHHEPELPQPKVRPRSHVSTAVRQPHFRVSTWTNPHSARCIEPAHS
jgi:hypothetical protein